jgi:hypothetical protein
MFLAKTDRFLREGTGAEMRAAFDDNPGGLSFGVGVDDAETW